MQFKLAVMQLPVWHQSVAEYSQGAPESLRCLLLAVDAAVGRGLAEVAVRPAADQVAARADGDMLCEQTPHCLRNLQAEPSQHTADAPVASKEEGHMDSLAAPRDAGKCFTCGIVTFGRVAASRVAKPCHAMTWQAGNCEGRVIYLRVIQGWEGFKDDGDLPLSHGSASLEQDLHTAHLHDQQILDYTLS